MSGPCKRCGGSDDHNHDLTDCIARLTVDRRQLKSQLTAALTRADAAEAKVRDMETLLKAAGFDKSTAKDTSDRLRFALAELSAAVEHAGDVKTLDDWAKGQLGRRWCVEIADEDGWRCKLFGTSIVSGQHYGATPDAARAEAAAWARLLNPESGAKGEGGGEGMTCFRCGEPAGFAYCSACSAWLARERMWQEAGFNPDDTTPFDPDGELALPSPQQQPHPAADEKEAEAEADGHPRHAGKP